MSDTTITVEQYLERTVFHATCAIYRHGETEITLHPGPGLRTVNAVALDSSGCMSFAVMGSKDSGATGALFRLAANLPDRDGDLPREALRGDALELMAEATAEAAGKLAKTEAE